MQIHCEHTVEGQEPPIYNFKKVSDKIYALSEKIYGHIVPAKKMKLPKFVEVIDQNYNHFLAVIQKFFFRKGTKDQIESYQAIMCPRECRQTSELVMNQS